MPIIKTFDLFESENRHTYSTKKRKKITLNESDMDLIESVLFDIKDEFGLTEIIQDEMPSMDRRDLRGDTFYCVFWPYTSKSTIQINFWLHHEYHSNMKDGYEELDGYLRDKILTQIKSMGYFIEHFVTPCFDRTIINVLVSKLD